jgi:hypothetical protein
LTDKASLLRAYKYLERCDTAYTEHHTPENNRLIVRAQRVYYRRFIAYTRATLPEHEARVKIARALHVRAQTNRKRLPTHEDWQDLTRNQVRRANTLRMRAIALSEYEHPTTPYVRPVRTMKLQRMKHPITGRMVYYDHETDTYHRQYPTQPVTTHAPLD